MRMYSFFTSMLVAGVMTTSGYGQTVVDSVGRDVTRGAQNLAGKAQVTGDIARDTVRNTADAARRGVNAVRNGVNEAADLNAGARLNADARSQASRDFDNADRNADWRFVERDGAWWYRTPMNTWMVQRDGRWVNYEGQNGMNGRYNDRQVVNSQYVDNGQQYAAQQTQHTEQRQYASTSQPEAQGTHQEYMCIDGKRRLVTVISTSSDQGTESQRSEEATTAEQSNRGEQAERYTAARPLTPPPAPAPGDFEDRDADLPEAPSRDAILNAQGANDLGAQAEQANVNVNAEAEASTEAESTEPRLEAEAATAIEASTAEPQFDAQAPASTNAGVRETPADAGTTAAENTSSNTMTEAPAEMDKQ